MKFKYQNTHFSMSRLFVSLLPVFHQRGHKIRGISKGLHQNYPVLFDCCQSTEISVQEPTFKPMQRL